MNINSLLHRQVNPIQVQDGRVNSQIFTPMPKDKKQLSVDDGEKLSAENSFRRFIANGFDSCGVLSVTVTECKDLNLEVFPDELENNPDHALIDFTSIATKSQVKKTASKLLKYAEERGWSYRSKDEMDLSQE